MSSVAAALKFEIYQAGAHVRTEELSQAIIKIGKLPGSHLRLDDARVSRIHAVIERSGEGEVYLIDLGSSLGTWVGGKRISKHLLSTGDEITLGDTRIRVSLQAPSSTPEIPQGWRDEAGDWHDGVGGRYDTAGNYFDGRGGYYDPEGEYHAEEEAAPPLAPRDVDLLSASYLEEYDVSGALEVAFLWNDHIAAVNSYKEGVTLTIGESKDNTFVVKHPSIPDSAFPLLQPSASGGVTVNFTDTMDGLICIDDARYSLGEAVRSGVVRQGSYGAGSYSLDMTRRTRARLDFGANTLLVHYADIPQALPAGRMALSGDLFGAAAVSLALHAAFMFVALYLPPDAHSFELNDFSIHDRFVTSISKTAEPVDDETPKWLDDDSGEPDASSEQAAGAEGQAGVEDSRVKNKRVAIKGPSTNNRVQIPDREVAYNTGALSVLNRSTLAMTGVGDALEGFDPVTAMGDNNGGEIGDAYGFGAFGKTGMGRGANGTGESGFNVGGPGGFDLVSRNRKEGRPTRYGKTDGKLTEHAPKVPQVIGQGPVVQGSLSREIIRRVIRRHIREVKYCYEQELIKNKGLAGRIVMKFTITGTGRVVGASPTSNTVNSAVGSCVSGKVRRWVFPQPENGGIVIVSYPFVFSAR